jgi:uncharacterized RDD family membrane protein YckC
METSYQIVTKPNLLKRTVAFLVDYGIIGCYFALMLYLYGTPNDKGGYSVNGLPAFSIILVWFGVLIGTELMNGRTLGNQLMKLRAIPKEDYRGEIGFKESFLRHIVDILDVIFYGLVAIILIKRTEYNQRFGDLLGKTIVIDESDSEQGIKKVDNKVS